MLHYDDFDWVIICDNKGRPMAWDGEQLCYCENEHWQDRAFPVKAYSKATAKKYIEKAKKFRLDKNWDAGEYVLYPISIAKKSK